MSPTNVLVMFCDQLRRDLLGCYGNPLVHTPNPSAYFGKWHIGPAADLFASAFEHTQRPGTQAGGDPPYLDSTQWPPSTDYWPMVRSVEPGHAGTVDVPIDEFPDGLAARYASDFLGSRDPDRPFLLFCAFPGPHGRLPWPWTAQLKITTLRHLTHAAGRNTILPAELMGEAECP